MDLTREVLSKNLIDLRRSKGLTQVEVADRISVTHSTYNTWENGAWPSSASLEKLAAFYGVRSTRFFHDPDLDLSANPPPKTPSIDERLKALDPSLRSTLETLIDNLLKGK